MIRQAQNQAWGMSTHFSRATRAEFSQPPCPAYSEMHSLTLAHLPLTLATEVQRVPPEEACPGGEAPIRIPWWRDGRSVPKHLRGPFELPCATRSGTKRARRRLNFIPPHELQSLPQYLYAGISICCEPKTSNNGRCTYSLGRFSQGLKNCEPVFFTTSVSAGV